MGKAATLRATPSRSQTSRQTVVFVRTYRLLPCRAVPKGDLEKSLLKLPTATRSRYGRSPIKYGLIINSNINEVIRIFSDKKQRKVAAQSCICEYIYELGIYV